MPVSQTIDIQTSTRDWNHLVFRAGSLLPEVVIIPSNLSHRRLVLLLQLLPKTLIISLRYKSCSFDNGGYASASRNPQTRPYRYLNTSFCEKGNKHSHLLTFYRNVL